jgi:hypothetical protein
MKNSQMLLSILISISLLAIASCSTDQKKDKQRERIEMDTIASIPTPPILKYGIPVDSFIIEDGTIKPNQHLSHILSGYGVSMATIDRIAREAKEIFDVRKIRGGSNFSIFQTADSLNETR